MAANKSPQEHQRLSMERVLHEAVKYADREGVESLSMRKLADALGAGTMSLYHHVPNKDALLDEMVDAVFARIDAPSTEGFWKDELRKRAVSTRQALKRHPWAVGLMESRLAPGPANRRLHDAVLACLREAGFSVADSVHAYSVQDAYIYGFALQESTLPFDTGEEAAAIGAMMIEQFQQFADELPYTFEVVGGYVAKGGYDPTAEFIFGLDLVLDGLERYLESRRAK